MSSEALFRVSDPTVVWLSVTRWMPSSSGVSYLSYAQYLLVCELQWAQQQVKALVHECILWRLLHMFIIEHRSKSTWVVYIGDEMEPKGGVVVEAFSDLGGFVFQLAWTQPQCPKPCSHPFRPSQHDSVYQPMEFYNDVSVDHYKPSIFELRAQEQLQDLQPTLKYILSICMSMLTLVLHIHPPHSFLPKKPTRGHTIVASSQVCNVCLSVLLCIPDHWLTMPLIRSQNVTTNLSALANDSSMCIPNIW